MWGCSWRRSARYTNSFGAGGADLWLIETDSSGVMQWNQIYGGALDDWGWCVIQTSDGGYAIVGYTYSYGPGTPDYANVYLVKTNTLGLLDWNL